MTTQNDPLPEALRAYVRTVETRLAQSGVEALARHGIIRDLEGQIADMRTEEGMSDDAILASLDAPESFAEAYTGKTPQVDGVFHPSKSDAAAPIVKTMPDTRGRIVYILVAILATVTISAEAAVHMCALSFFDPMPTYLHLIMLASTPAMIVATSLLLGGGRAPARIGWLCFGNGYLVAVSLLYVVAFVPLMPIAFVAVIIYGLGLLPLTPAIVFVASICQGLQLRRQAKSTPARGLVRRWLAGFAVAALLLGGWHGYTALLDDALRKAASPGPEERAAGLDRLRLLGGEHYVLEGCFPRSRKAIGGIRVNRAVYYMLTGRDYREGKRALWYFGWRWNPEMEDSGVGAANNALRLKSADYDISAAGSDAGDAGPGVAYAELTLEFDNAGPSPAEARCQIVMPPGGVASRLTLWIDGEEREAAFGKRSAVQNAYMEVTGRGRDPALLVATGPDRVQLQCFPVPPGGSMRVKAGFSLPLSPENGKAFLRLPYIAERNFDFELEKGVSVWAESDAPLAAGGALSQGAEDHVYKEGAAAKRGAHAIRGHVAPDDLHKALISLPLPGAPAAYRAELSGIAAVSELRAEEPLATRLVAVVLDASRQCEDFWRPGNAGSVPWDRVLKMIPAGCRVALFAGDASLPPLSAEEAAGRWPDVLSRIEYRGADEQVGNLEKAWDLCADEPNAAVLWLHGPLPVKLSDLAGLSQRFRRRPPRDGGPVVYSLQVLPGPNRIEERLFSGEGLARLPSRFSEPAGEWAADLFANMRYPGFARERYSFSLRRDDENEGDRYGHVARLAAAHEAERLLAGNADAANTDIIADAVRLRLVTRATGAVVLENMEQYKEHSLDPAASVETVPTIPEPEEWAMLAIAALFVAIAYRRRSKQGTGA